MLDVTQLKCMLLDDLFPTHLLPSEMVLNVSFNIEKTI